MRLNRTKPNGMSLKKDPPKKDYTWEEFEKYGMPSDVVEENPAWLYDWFMSGAPKSKESFDAARMKDLGIDVSVGPRPQLTKREMASSLFGMNFPEEQAPRTISYQDIARRADEKAGKSPKYTFDELMDLYAYGESGGENIYQRAPLLRKERRAQTEWQMEEAARRDAAKYADKLAKGMGLDPRNFTDEEIMDAVGLSDEDRKLLAYAYMYGRGYVPTAEVLSGRMDPVDFWQKYWNMGTVDRRPEFRERVKSRLK